MFDPPDSVELTPLGNSLAFAPIRNWSPQVFEHDGQLFFPSADTGRIARVFNGVFSYYTDVDALPSNDFHVHDDFIYKWHQSFIISDGHYFKFYRIPINNNPGPWELIGTVYLPVGVHETQNVNADLSTFMDNYFLISLVNFNYETNVSTVTVRRIEISTLTVDIIFAFSTPSNVWNNTGFLYAHLGKLYLFRTRGNYPFNSYYGVFEWSDIEDSFEVLRENYVSAMPGGASRIHAFYDFAASGRFIKCGFSVNDSLGHIYLLLYDIQENEFKNTTDLGTYSEDVSSYGRNSELVLHNGQYYLFVWNRLYSMNPETCELTLLYTFPAEAGSTYFNLLYVTSTDQLVGLKTTATTSEPISFDGPYVWTPPIPVFPLDLSLVEIIYPVIPADEENTESASMGNGDIRVERKTETILVERKSTLHFKVDRSIIGSFEGFLHSHKGQQFRLVTPGYTPFGVNSSDNLVYCLTHPGAKPSDKHAMTFDIDVTFLFVSVTP